MALLAMYSTRCICGEVLPRQGKKRLLAAAAEGEGMSRWGSESTREAMVTQRIQATRRHKKHKGSPPPSVRSLTCSMLRSLISHVLSWASHSDSPRESSSIIPSRPLTCVREVHLIIQRPPRTCVSTTQPGSPLLRGAG
jgi:hypothetical protein